MIEQTKKVETSVVVPDDLKNIRERINFGRKMNRILHNWNFRQLQDFIQYKTEWKGIPIHYLDAEYTSRA